MKILRKDTDYALAAIVYLAGRAGEDAVSAKELAGALKIPHGFLRKILKQLGAAGIVSSSAGKKGGFALVGKPDKLSVYSVMKAVQGPVYGTECAVNRNVCPNTVDCPVRQVMIDCTRKLELDLDKVMISNLVNNREQENKKGRK